VDEAKLIVDYDTIGSMTGEMWYDVSADVAQGDVWYKVDVHGGTSSSSLLLSYGSTVWGSSSSSGSGSGWDSNGHVSVQHVFDLQDVVNWNASSSLVYDKHGLVFQAVETRTHAAADATPQFLAKTKVGYGGDALDW
jgi:hypothetical protein